MNNDKNEDKRIEYQVLRTELNQADKTCLIITGFLFTAFGALFSIDKGNENMLVIMSFLSLIALLYYTEKRFIIRKISYFIQKKICTDDSGFGWEKYVGKSRNKRTLRPIAFLRPYYFELFLCLLGALSPLIYPNFLKNTICGCYTFLQIIWILIISVIIILSIVFIYKYERLKTELKDSDND